MIDKNKTLWFPMRVRYSSAPRMLALRDELNRMGCECYIPMEYRQIGEHTKFVPRISNLIFLHAPYTYISQIKQQPEFINLSYIMHNVPFEKTKTSEALYVPEKMMNDFIRVTNEQNEQVVFLDNMDFACKPGAHVKITEGAFAGVEGVVKSIKKHLCVVLPIKGVVAVAITNVPKKNLMYIKDGSETETETT